MSNTSTTPPRLAEADFCSWVGRAAPGDIFEYHRGFLGIDVAPGTLPAAEQKALRHLARRALWASGEGLVHLVQRRVGPGEFAYLAIRRPRPRVAAHRKEAHRPQRRRGARAGGGGMTSDVDAIFRHLTQAELAERWRVSTRTLDRWREAGKGPAWMKLNGRVLYRTEDVLAFERARLRRT